MRLRVFVFMPYDNAIIVRLLCYYRSKYNTSLSCCNYLGSLSPYHDIHMYMYM